MYARDNMVVTNMFMDRPLDIQGEGAMSFSLVAGYFV